MKIVRYIQANMEKQLNDWEEAACRIAPELEGKDSRTVRDHAEAMLEFIIKDLSAPESRKRQSGRVLVQAEQRMLRPPPNGTAGSASSRA